MLLARADGARPGLLSAGNLGQSAALQAATRGVWLNLEVDVPDAVFARLMTRARGFYEGVLGLKTGDVWNHEGRAWVEYDIGAATLAISNMAGEKWKPSSDGPAVALEVEDFDDAVATLREHGVTFAIEPTESPTCRLAVVCDPDGNTLAIHQKHAH